MPATTFNGCLVTLYRNENQALAALEGALRMGNSEAVKQSVFSLLTEGTEALSLYLGRLTELDSAGLGVLVGMHMTARSRKIKLQVLSPTAFVTKLFESTKLNSVLGVIGGTEAETIRDQLIQEKFEVDSVA